MMDRLTAATEDIMTELIGPMVVTESRGRGSLEPGTVIPKGMKSKWLGDVEYIVETERSPGRRLLEELVRSL